MLRSRWIYSPTPLHIKIPLKCILFNVEKFNGSEYFCQLCVWLFYIRHSGSHLSWVRASAAASGGLQEPHYWFQVGQVYLMPLPKAACSSGHHLFPPAFISFAALWVRSVSMSVTFRPSFCLIFTFPVCHFLAFAFSTGTPSIIAPPWLKSSTFHLSL